MTSFGSVLAREKNVAGLVPGVPEREESWGSAWASYEQEEVGFEEDMGWTCLIGRGQALPARDVHRLAIGHGECGCTGGKKMRSDYARESRGVGHLRW
jgi:hypothetical protein